MGVWVGGRDEVLSVSLPTSREKYVCTHTHTRIFLYVIATVTESSEVAPLCQINASLKMKNVTRRRDF